MSPQPFQPHYNYAVGSYVTNQQDFYDKLKRLGDEQSERTGISASYEPIHPADLRANPPPESSPSHLDRLVAHDEHGRPMHRPVNTDPTILAERHRQERAKQQEKAFAEAETTDLIPEDDSD